MRKNLILTIIIIILIANFVSAQNTRLGIFGGPVAATMFKKVGGEKHNSDYVMGATGGILLDVPMQRYGSFQPGLNYVGKNSKDEVVSSSGEHINTKTTLSYLELPLNVLFRIPASSGNVTVGTGVAAAVALGGTMSSTGPMTNETKKLTFGDNATNDFARYDFGINALAGYEFKNNFFVTLNYNIGIHRLFVGGDPDDKLYNRYFALRIGLLIGGKK
jgi:hypothetical protein